MPVVLRVGRYTFHFYSSDGKEPLHVHVRAGSDRAKFWLRPTRLDSSHGFSTHEVNEIEKLIQKHKTLLEEKWNAYFSKK